jgi:hypothetical protein
VQGPYQLLRGRFTCPPGLGFAQGHQNAIIGRTAPLRKKHLPRLGDTRVGQGDRVSSDDPSSASTPNYCLVDWCQVGVRRARVNVLFICHLYVLPANDCIFEVEPRGIEPLTSAVQRRSEGFVVVHCCSKTRISKLISLTDPPRMFTAVQARCRQTVDNRRRVCAARGSDSVTQTCRSAPIFIQYHNI